MRRAGADTGSADRSRTVFTYTVSDGISSTTTALTVNVNGTNDAPIANDDFATATEDVAGTTPAVFNVLTNDTEIDAGDSKTVTSFTYAGQTQAAGSAITNLVDRRDLNVANDGTVTFTQNGAFNGLAQGAITRSSSPTRCRTGRLRSRPRAARSWSPA